MYFVQFYQERTDRYNPGTRKFETCESYLDTPCGTDSIFILDGRKRLDKQIQDAIQQAQRLEKVHPDYKAFQIFKGTIKNNYPLTRIISIKP